MITDCGRSIGGRVKATRRWLGKGPKAGRRTLERERPAG